MPTLTHPDDRIAALIEQKRQLKESRVRGSHASAIRRQAVKESINTMKSTQNFKVFMWCVCGVGGMFVARACARVCVFDFSVVCV